MQNQLLRVENLTVDLDGLEIIRNLSFSMERGDKKAVKGESGSGKTTLLKCILGFEKRTSGGIWIDGHALGPDNVWDLRKRVVLVPQEPDLGDGGVSDFIRRPFSFKNNKNLAFDKNRVMDLFREFKLDEDLWDKDVSLLSGGEKQRIALISALLLDREIYILDEVTSALDERIKKRVVFYFLGRKDLTVLASSHDSTFLSAVNGIIDLPRLRRNKD
jgi:ABC-type multidrug transport system ATPase subunit